MLFIALGLAGVLLLFILLSDTSWAYQHARWMTRGTTLLVAGFIAAALLCLGAYQVSRHILDRYF